MGRNINTEPSSLSRANLNAPGIRSISPWTLFMAALSQFPTFQSLGTRKFFSVHLTSPHCSLPSLSSRNNSGISVSSTQKPRANRKVKSNAELVNDLREFIFTAGLPLDHVPSTKELSAHGRQDLANIVRRRGYKFVRELLADHLQPGTISSSGDADLNESEELLVDLEDMSAGQNTSAEDLADANCLSNEASKVEEQTENFAEDKVISNEVTDVEERIVALVEDASLLCQSTVTKDDLIRDDEISGEVESEPSCTDPTSSDCRSLTEKVDKFLEDGELGNIEELADHVFYDAGGVDEGHGQMSLSSQLLERPSHKIDISSTERLSNEEPTTTSREPTTTSSHSEKLHVELNADNQAEISRLKFLLHQKELELTHLKEQIEEEKHALSVLQTKAESELSKAQKLILEKDTELHDAENSLSGLKEVELQFRGEGDIVEVAGSFNGWHHRIKMDVQPSAIVSDQSGSRNSRLWKTALWLYPGVYEIKFVVDGHWMIDPQRETITKGPIHNNILRVEDG